MPNYTELMSKSNTLLSSTLSLCALALCTLTGCNVDEQESITVAVYPTTQRCGINEQMMICGEVGAYLRDTLKLKPDRSIIVSAVGIDPLPKDDNSLNKIAETIKAVGFKDVRTANFDVQ